MSRLLKRVANRTRAAKLTTRMVQVFEGRRIEITGVIAGRNLVYANGRAIPTRGIEPIRPNEGPGSPGNNTPRPPAFPSQPTTIVNDGGPGSAEYSPLAGTDGTFWDWQHPAYNPVALPPIVPITGAPPGTNPIGGNGRDVDGVTVIATFGSTINNSTPGGDTITTTIADLRDNDTLIWLQAQTWDASPADEYALSITGTWSVALDNYDNQPAPWGPVTPTTGYKYVAKKLTIAVDGSHTVTWTPTANMQGATMPHGYVLRGVLSKGEAGDTYVGVSTGEPSAWPFTVSPGDYGGASMIGLIGGNITPAIASGSEVIHSDGGVSFLHTGVLNGPITLQDPANSATGATFLIVFLGTSKDTPLGAASEIGQVLYSTDGATMAPATPITSGGMWLIGDDGIPIVQ